MLVEVRNLTKSMGAKDLFHDLSFGVDKGQKVALIGRNGQGKTTILRLLAGEEGDYGGEIIFKKGVTVVHTKQEHHSVTNHSALTYILQAVPSYNQGQAIMQEFTEGKHTNVGAYSQALEYFTEHGYFSLPEKILRTLARWDVGETQARAPLSTLSGGEKRYVELARLIYAKADLYLIDEPTNHMDYLGKERFIEWLTGEKKGVLVVTHDRDVLKVVDTIIELKDKQLFVFKGNFDHYRKQNASQTLNSVKQYQDQLNRLKEAKKRMEWGKRMRAKSKEWKIRYDHWLRDYEKVKAETIKPAFWIDQESTESLDRKVTDSYHLFKEKNIKITVHAATAKTTRLVEVRKLSLGYDTPLFENLNFSMKNHDRLLIKGRNGAGKSTLVKTMLALYRGKRPEAVVVEGEIGFGRKLVIGEYQQEIDPGLLDQTLEMAIYQVYEDVGNPLEERQVKSLLSQYLFDPHIDGKQMVKSLSGGQRARYQLIRMLAHHPNLLILDEPTNHLDLPSIEELEKVLRAFEGGILYISHDTYFINAIGGTTIEF